MTVAAYRERKVAMDKYIGAMLDNRYELLEVIGVGGMAVVYKAMCHRLNRLVAIKILKDEYSNDEEFRRRFHGESQAVAMMSHPNIVNVFDVSNTDGLNYIVMELIDGITLKQYMEKKGILSWRETLHFSMQIAKALEHAHSRGIIHRDIKPHNVMILKDGSVKVADFGIARVASAQNTLTKEALGSVHYISPEQARGARVDNRTDLYSLGVVMYQMLAGRPPYDGDSPVAVAIKHINGNPLKPSLFNSNIPLGLEQITMHAMSTDLNTRYATAGEMLRDMEELRKDPSLVFNFAAASAVDRTQTTARTQPATKQATAGVERSQARKLAEREKAEQEEKKRRLILVVVAILAASVLLVISALIISAAVRAGSSGRNATTEDTTLSTEEIKVPNFVGMTWSDDLAAAFPNFQLVVDADSYEYSDAYEAGVIIRQDVEPEMTVKPGRRIYLTVSKGQQGKMPDLVGKSVDYAKQYFDGMGYKVIYEEENSLTVEKDHIIRTDPVSGKALKDDDLITVYVSSGPKLLVVPSVEIGRAHV